MTRLDRPRYRTPQGRLDVVERDARLLLTPFKMKGMGPSWSTAQDARSNRRRDHCAPPRAGNMAGPLMQMPNGQMIVRSPARRPSARSAFRGARDRPPRCHLYFRKRDLTDASPPARKTGGGTSGDGDHSFEERHSRAMSLKREGNAAFGNGNLELALACYVRSAAEWAWFEQRGEDMPLVRSYADIEDEEQRCVCDRMPRQTQHNPSVRAACTLSRTRTLTRACISRSRARLLPGIAP